MLLVLVTLDISCTWKHFSDKEHVLIWVAPQIERICLHTKFWQEYFNLILTAVCWTKWLNFCKLICTEKNLKHRYSKKWIAIFFFSFLFSLFPSLSSFFSPVNTLESRRSNSTTWCYLVNSTNIQLDQIVKHIDILGTTVCFKNM